MKIILFCAIIILFAFANEKQYSMKFTQPEIIQILQVVDESNAPHSTVKRVQEILNRELRQYVDSSGRLK